MQSDLNFTESILIVDSDIENAEAIQTYLEEHDYTALILQKGEDIISFISKNEISLIVLEVKLKPEDGFELCKKVRQYSHVPIIFLSSFAEPSDRILGLELGADDYMAKPFEKRELLARIKAVLRRAKIAHKAEEPSAVHYYKFEEFTLDCTSRHLINGEEEIVELSGAEYRLLHYFLTKAQQVLSRESLIEVIQGRTDVYERSPFDRSIDVQVSRLRARLKDNERQVRLIKTVRGDGYVFTGKVDTILHS